MIELNINASIYAKKNIDKVKQLYNDLAKIEEEQISDGICLKFYECALDEKTTVMEFENYLIGLENSNGSY